MAWSRFMMTAALLFSVDFLCLAHQLTAFITGWCSFCPNMIYVVFIFLYIFCYFKSVTVCWMLFKPPAEGRKNTGDALHGNLVKAPNHAALAYHRRRMCHFAVSSLWWPEQEVIVLNTPTWQGLLVTDFLSVTPGDWERQPCRAPLKPIIENAF